MAKSLFNLQVLAVVTAIFCVTSPLPSHAQDVISEPPPPPEECPPGTKPIMNFCAPFSENGRPKEPGWVRGNYYAVAAHRQASDAWIASGYRGRDSASIAALAACNQSMGGGCEISSAEYNTNIVVAKSSKGELFVGNDQTRRKAEAKVIGHCQSQNQGRCVVIRVVEVKRFDSGGKNENPQLSGPGPGENVRYAHSALAWGTEGSQYVWFSGGHPTQDAAKAEAIRACEAGLAPQRCVVAQTNASTHIGLLTAQSNGETRYYTGLGHTADIAREDSLKWCNDNRLKECNVVATLDARTAETRRIEPRSVGKPFFTAQAWTKGSAAPWQNSVWSISGGEDEETTKAAALAACRNESKQECEIATWSFDSKVGLYVDQTGYVRLRWANHNDDPTPAAQKVCAEAKVTCRLVKVIDARVPTTERVEVK